LPLAEADADDDDAPLQIDADNLSLLAEARHLDAVLRLEAGASLPQSGGLLGLALQLRRFLGELLTLPLRLVLGLQRLGVSLLRLFAQLLQAEQFRSAALPASQVLVGPAE